MRVRGVFLTFYWDFYLGGDILLHIKRFICFIFIKLNQPKIELEHFKACLINMTHGQTKKGRPTVSGGTFTPCQDCNLDFGTSQRSFISMYSMICVYVIITARLEVTAPHQDDLG